MGWREGSAAVRRILRASAALATAALLAGCFQPLYGSGTGTGRPAIREALSAVAVDQISAAAQSDEARLAVQIRNDLLFNFTGGDAPERPTHRLKINITGARGAIGAVSTGGLPNAELYGLRATYTLIENATGKVVVTGSSGTSVAFDTIGTQRFARISAMQDSERRAAKVIADNITTRLAAYFISGT